MYRPWRDAGNEKNIYKKMLVTQYLAQIWADAQVCPYGEAGG